MQNAEKTINLLNVFRSECVATGAEYTSREAVLKTIVELAKRSPILENIEESVLLKGLVDREELSTTGFGNGIAIPHCRLAGVEDFVVGILALPRGIDFKAMDDEPVKLFITREN